MKPPAITLEYVRSFLNIAKHEFSFLSDRGFTLVEEKPPSSTSYRDGFRLRYAGSPVAIVVDYYEMEFFPTFSRGSTEANYYFIDYYLFANRSGYGGGMFPLDKLAAAIANIASDIRENYGSILAGDETTWTKISALLNAPREKKRRLP